MTTAVTAPPVSGAASAPSTFVSGLAGVVAAQTRLSHVDGEAGVLLIGGYPVEDLAPQATFEEVTYLLWHGALPTAAQLAAFTAAMTAQRELPPAAFPLLQAAAEAVLPVMDALRLA